MNSSAKLMVHQSVVLAIKSLLYSTDTFAMARLVTFNSKSASIAAFPASKRQGTALIASGGIR